MVTAAELTGRIAEVYERLQREPRMSPAEIAEELSISRNAVYQHIGRLKRDGIIADDQSSPTRAPARRQPRASEPARDDSVMTEVQQLAQRMEARLTEIDEQTEQLARERERITVTLEALAPVITPDPASNN